MVDSWELAKMRERYWISTQPEVEPSGEGSFCGSVQLDCRLVND